MVALDIVSDPGSVRVGPEPGSGPVGRALLSLGPALLLILASACGSGAPDMSGNDAGVLPVAGTPREDSGVMASSGILVDEVFDGDTIRVQASAVHKAPDGRSLSGVHIRLLGIDSPEIAHPPKPADCWGDEASAFAHELLGGQFVRLEYDLDHEVRDPYDRLLAYVVLEDGRVANEVLLEQGEARSFRFPHKERERYDALEREARRENLGMWTCP